MRRAVLTGVLLALFVSAPAQAGTVTLINGLLSVHAFVSETNTVTMRLPDEQGGVSVSDTAGIEAGQGCLPQTPTSVRCVGPATNAEIWLGDRDDSLVIQNGNTASFVIDAGTGDDIVNAPSAGKIVFAGGHGADTVLAGPEGDRLDGGDGDDVLAGGAGIDHLAGGEGADTLRGGLASDMLRGGGGPDLLRGEEGVEVSDAGGILARDDLDGGDGDDVLDGGPGPDLLAGGAGQDTVTYAPRLVAVHVALDGQRNDGQEDEEDAVAGDVEAVLGGAGDDVLIGSAAGDALDGGAGNDVVDSGGGPDQLRGGVGQDRLIGGTGRDALDAGAGDDVVDARERDGDPQAPADWVQCADGSDQAQADALDVVHGCEALVREALPSDGGVTAGPAAADAGRPGLPDRRVGRAPAAGPQPALGIPWRRGDVVVLPVHCSPGRSACRIAATVRLLLPRRPGARKGSRSPSRLVGHRSASVAPGQAALVEVPLGRTARRLLAGRKGALRAAAAITLRRRGRPHARYARPLMLSGTGRAR